MTNILIGMLAHDRERLHVGGTVLRVDSRYAIVRTDDGDDVKIPLERTAKGRPVHGPPVPEDLRGLEDVARFCNCAACGAELLGASNPPVVRELLRHRPLVAGRRNDRPYCLTCLASAPADAPVSWS